MFNAGSGSILVTVISALILGFVFWVIHKITNL